MGSGLVVEGVRRRSPDLHITSWLDCPDCWSGGKPRARDWVRAVIWHGSTGVPHDRETPPAPVLPGAGPGHGARRCSYEVWDHAERSPGAHLVVDHDGSVYQVTDTAAAATWCPPWRAAAVQLALFQGRAGEVYEAQLETAVLLTDAVTRALGIQRQIPHRYLGPVPRLVDAQHDVVGVFGHRDAARNRGPGDPGSPLFYRLGCAGYDVVDFSLMGDRSIWVRRQRILGVRPDDGIASLATVASVKASGRPHGLWVRRPGD